jgi:hypothetical protein
VIARQYESVREQACRGKGEREGERQCLCGGRNKGRV